MRRQRRIALSEKLVYLAFVIFCFGLCLMLNFGELPFLVCLSFSLALCVVGMVIDHRRKNSQVNRYLP